MCVIVDIFQAASAQVKWLFCLLTIIGVYSFLYWFILIPLVFELLKNAHKTEHWAQHWTVIYFALAFLIWSIIMFLIVGVWLLCRKRAFQNVEDPIKDSLVTTKEDYTRISEVNEKVRHTLGLDGDFQNIRKSVLERKVSTPMKKEANNEINDEKGFISKMKSKKKKEVEDLDLVKDEVTPLPEYSPEAKESIFDFSPNCPQEENERSRSPFREFLHLVQIESPGSPEKSFEEELLACLEPGKEVSCLKPRTSMDCLPDDNNSTVQGEKAAEHKQEQTVNTEHTPADNEGKDENETINCKEVDENTDIKQPTKPLQRLVRKESSMFLGNIGRTQSVLSEMFMAIEEGQVLVETAWVTGRHQILAHPP